MPKVAIVAITKHGISIAHRIQGQMSESEIFAPIKLNDQSAHVNWYSNDTSQRLAELFGSYESIICIFSLGATIRLLAPHLKDKKTDPGILVIDDSGQFVISTLSGHLGGANALTRRVAALIGAQPVITTAADVRGTIPVDLVGHEYGWTISNFGNVTKVSAMMVNEEPIAIYQDCGETNWWKSALPNNVRVVSSIDEVKKPEYKAALVISDKAILDNQIAEKSVVFRPKSLVVGVGLHRDTTAEKIESGIRDTLKRAGLEFDSIRNLATADRGANLPGLDEFCSSFRLSVSYFSKDELATIQVPNPSETVQMFEGTPSVSDAAAIASSKGNLIVQKTKFPPDLTVAICRVRYR